MLKDRDFVIIDRCFDAACKKNKTDGNARLYCKLDNGPYVYGTNRMKTHTMQNTFFQHNRFQVYLHAEIDAIVNFLRTRHPEDLMGASLHIARAKWDGEKYIKAIAKPCRGCESALRWFGVKRMVFSMDEFTISEQWLW